MANSQFWVFGLAVMGRYSTEKYRSVTPEMVAEILARHGQEVSLQRAAAILELMYELSWHSVALEIRLATSQVQQKLEKLNRNVNQKPHQNENCRSICKGKHRRTGR